MKTEKKSRGLISFDKIMFYFYFMMTVIEILKRTSLKGLHKKLYK